MGYYQVPQTGNSSYPSRGVRYVGDPGFLGSVGKVLGGVAGFLPGGAMVKGAVGTLAHVIGRARPKIAAAATTAITVAKAHPVITAAAGAATVGAVGAGGAMMMGGAGAAPVMPMRMTKGGKLLRMPGMRRHRRMRVANTKALHRAIRRVSGFEKLAKRVLRISSPRKRHVISGFKRKRARR